MAGSRVGEVRPTQLLSMYGVGSTVDLPQISVMVMGLDDWPITKMDPIFEARLLRLVRHLLGAQVRELKAAPFAQDQGLFDGGTIPEGVPVAAFPRWLVCTHCKLLAPIANGLFEFRGDSQRPERSRFVHTNCQRRNVEAIPARFLVACEDGHIDDFPWHQYLHDGATCDGQMDLKDVGPTGEAADTWLGCRTSRGDLHRIELCGP